VTVLMAFKANSCCVHSCLQFHVYAVFHCCVMYYCSVGWILSAVITDIHLVRRVLEMWLSNNGVASFNTVTVQQACVTVCGLVYYLSM